MDKSVAIFHPEGNFPNNPNLSGIIRLLLQRGFAVHVYCPPHPVHRLFPLHPRLRVYPVPAPPGSWDDLRGVLFPPGAQRRSMHFVALESLPRFSLVLGVDQGIVDAAWVARSQGIPHGLLSYELYFADEVGPDFKQDEIEACRDAVFALSQDEVRAECLARENAIAPGRILTMPVAGSGRRPGTRSFALHDALGLDRDTKIAVSIGSAEAPWAGSGQLLDNVEKWPDDWALVLHHRYDSRAVRDMLAGLCGRARGKVHVSPFPSLPERELHRLLHACDVGLCFYTPTYTHPTQGKNLERLGMSSGKFTTYLQHGLPVLVNDQAEMGGQVCRENLGWRVRDIGEVHRVLASVDRPALDARRESCLDFFTRRCDFDVTVPPLLEAIESACNLPRRPQTSPAGEEADTAALCVMARLRLARDDAPGAAASLVAALRRAGNEADFETVYWLALGLHKHGHLPEALAVYRCIYEDGRVGASLAAWALFKSGEARLAQGDEEAARLMFVQALRRNPAHAKAAIRLTPPGAPLRVRLAARSAPEPGVQSPRDIVVPMDPLDAALWEYYFSGRRPDRVEMNLCGSLTAGDAARLADVLAGHLAPGGRAVVRRTPEPSVWEPAELETAFARKGLEVMRSDGYDHDAAVLFVVRSARAGSGEATAGRD